VWLVFDLVGDLVIQILSPSDRPTRRGRLHALTAALILLGLLVAFVWWRNR
jgi:hypothetical protein